MTSAMDEGKDGRRVGQIRELGSHVWWRVQTYLASTSDLHKGFRPSIDVERRRRTEVGCWGVRGGGLVGLGWGSRRKACSSV